MQCYGYIITFGSSKSLKRCICNEAISTITIYESIYRDTGPIGGGGGALWHPSDYYIEVGIFLI